MNDQLDACDRDTAKRVLDVCELTPTWLEDPLWSPYVGDWRLPVRWRSIPEVAARYSFDEACSIYKVYRNHHRTRQILFDYWSWFAAARVQRGDFAT